MKEMALSVQEIKELMEHFQRTGLGSLKIEQGEFSLKLRRPRAEAAASGAGGAAIAAPAAGAAMPPAEQEAPARSGAVVTSPIVGTFYAAPGVDKEPYVRVGSRVKKGDVLFIIESMKLMNEVPSDVDGVVTEILVENAQGVEFGQPILCIE